VFVGNFTVLFAIDQLEHRRKINPSNVPLEEDEMFPQVKAIVKAANSKKALSILAFRVTHITEITQFMLIIEGMV
jgi:hypothetical protein